MSRVPRRSRIEGVERTRTPRRWLAVALVAGAATGVAALPQDALAGDPRLPGYKFCGWKDFGNGWTYEQPSPGAYLVGFAHGMTCRSARRNIDRLKYTRSPPYRPIRRGYRCRTIDSGYEFTDVRCIKRGSRGRVKFRLQTGS